MNSAASQVSNCPSPADLSRFALEPQSEPLAVQVQEHLTACNACRKWVEHLRQQPSSPAPDQGQQSTANLAATTDFREPGKSASRAVADAPQSQRYRIGAEIARGGMGVVHRATDVLFQREVAIKLLRLQLRNQPRSIAAFAYEAEITARLQHPGIPPVHDLGTLADQPFLAMKLVQGKTLQELLKARQSPLDDLPRWLQVFEQIAQAVGYAHSQGIIHRDLKPLNVMVGEFGEVQVMDWGLAKVLGRPEQPDAPSDEEDAAGSTTPDFVSRRGEVKGTLAYMPPEQARGEIDQLDARADVFGLGAILCQILTGKPVYVGKSALDLRRAAIAGDVESALAEIHHSGADPEIVGLAARCLAPDAIHRPPNATAVAQAVAFYRSSVEQRLRQAEMERALSQQRLLEQSRRRRLWYGIAAALFLFAVASSTLAFVFARSNTIIADRESKAQTAAELAAKREREAKAASELATSREKTAQQEAAISAAVTNFLQNDLLALAGAEEQAKAGVEVDPELKVRDLVLRAAQRIEGKFEDQPIVQARIRLMLGRSLARVGEAKLAIEQFKAAYDLYQATLGPEDWGTLAALSNLAGAYSDAGQLERALPLHEQALEIRQRVLGLEDPQTLDSMNNLAVAYQDMGQFDRALKLLDVTLKLRQKVLGPEDPDTLVTMNTLGITYGQMGQIDKALPYLENVLKLRQKVLGAEHPHTLDSMNGLAICCRHAGQSARALQLCEETLQIRRKVLGAEHPETLDSLQNLANAYLSADDVARALPLYEEALQGKRKVLGPDHIGTIGVMSNLALAYGATGQVQKAIPLHEETIKLTNAQLGPQHPQTLMSMLVLSHSQVQAERYADAEGQVNEVWKITQRLPSPIKEQLSLSAVKQYIRLYQAWGKSEEADKWALELTKRQPMPGAK